jgi:hypothetical protein
MGVAFDSYIKGRTQVILRIFENGELKRILRSERERRKDRRMVKNT